MESYDNVRPARHFGLISCVLFLIGGMIGSSIFSLSGLTIAYAGPAALLTWFIAATIQMMYGIQVAELSVVFPKSGGIFVFPAKSLGRTEQQGKIWGFVSAWGHIAVYSIAIAFAAIYIASYLGGIFPGLVDYHILISICACVFACLLNLFGARITKRAVTVLFAVLVSILLIFICTGLFGGNWDASRTRPFFSQGMNGNFGFITAVPNAMLAFTSIVAIAFMAGEVKNPNKNVPKSMVIAVSIVAGIYMLVIGTIIGLLNTTYFIDNPTMRFVPLFAVAKTRIQQVSWLPVMISISAVLALLNTMLVMTTLASHAIKATAEGGFFPKGLAKNNSRLNAPVRATLLVTAAGLVISCFPQFTALIVNIGSLFAVITIVINCISLMAARKKLPRIPGNFRAPGRSILPVVTIILIVAAYIPGLISSLSLWSYILVWYVLGAVILATAIYRLKYRPYKREAFLSIHVKEELQCMYNNYTRDLRF